MRTFLFTVSVVVLGVALGAGTAALRVRMAPWNPKTDESVETPPAEAPLPGQPTAKAVIDAEDYNFGNVDVGKSGGKHEFTFTNQGDGPLSLANGGTTCRCTMSELGKDKIPPGDSAKVTITWKPIERPGRYVQTAKILTNDPARPQILLKVSGWVTTAMRFSPPELIFTRLTTSENTTGHSRLYCYLNKSPKIIGHTWADPATASFFDVAFQPLSPDEVKEEPAAQSGWNVAVTVKSGLPQGPIHQKLTVQTDAPSPLSLPIEGTIGGEIAVAGPGWNADTNVLQLGDVSRQKGVKRRLLLLVRGPMRKDVEFKLEEVTPEVLKVSLGPRTEINNGAVVQIPLLIEIPPGSPSANHLGSAQGRMGEILLETASPHVLKVRIFVRFAIEG
jgi:hypothetical protein